MDSGSVQADSLPNAGTLKTKICPDCGTSVSWSETRCYSCRHNFRPPLTSKLKWVVISVALVGAAFVFWPTRAPDVDIKMVKRDPMASSPSVREPLSAYVTAASVSATELFAAYEANEVAADRKYKGRRISVHGTIESIAKDIVGTPYLALSAGEFGSVQCMFSAANESALASLSKGKPIIVSGKCSGKMMNVILRDCSLP